MTFPSSGQQVFPTELNNELLRSGSLTMPNDITRWLADKPTGPLTFPTDFYGKAAVKYVVADGFTALGTSHSFTGVDFGPDYTGRRILVFVECRNKASAVTTGWNMTSILIGGVSVSNASPYYYQDGSGSTFFIGLLPLSANPTGTSGNVSFNSTQQTQCRIHVVSVSGISSTLTDTGTAIDASSVSCTVSGGVTAASNGMIIAAGYAFRNSGNPNASSFGAGWTNLTEFVSSTNYRFCLAFRNRQSAGSKAVTYTTGNTQDRLIAIAVSRQG